MRKILLFFVVCLSILFFTACDGVSESFTISFVDHDGTVIHSETVEVDADLDSIDIPADPTREGYTFNGWDLSVPDVMPEDNVTITATYTINEYTLSFVDHDGTVLQTADFDFGASLTSVTAPADPTREGYTFDDWDMSIPATMPANDVMITATYTINTYTLSFVDHDGTVLQTADFDFGASLSSVTAPADPTREGYTFDDWDMSIPATMPGNDVLITATYTISQSTIAFEVNGGSTIADITADYMSNIIFPENPEREGFVFEGWFEDEELTIAFTMTTMPAEDITLYAKWLDVGAIFDGENEDVYRFEAEDAEITGTPQQEGSDWIEDVPIASGGQSVGFLGVVGNKVTYQVNASQATSAIFSLLLSSTNFSLQTFTVGDQVLNPDLFEITVNGVTVDYPEATIIGSHAMVWNEDWSPLFVFNVNLVAGENTIVCHVLDAAAGPNMDYLDIYAPDAVLTAGTGGSAGLNYEGTTSYDVIIEGFEWGPSVTQMVVHFPDDVIDAADFDETTFEVFAGTSRRTILAAYLSDQFGEPITETTGHYITFDLEIGYASSAWGGSPIDNSGVFTYNMTTSRNTFRDLAIYRVELASEQTFDIDATTYDDFSIPATAYNDYQIPSTDNLLKDSHTEDDITLTYAAYETTDMENDGVLNSLIIWLHGAGEGGTDVDVALLGNEAVALMKDPIQSYFRTGDSEGAYVLVVQTPTMWMDDGTGNYTDGSLPSMYTDALMATIEAYVAANTDVDPHRIYLGGCSNGGYMTINMLIENPNYFAAAYPICEAYADAQIDAVELAILKDVPMWFVAAANDTTVDPDNYSVATYTRLVQAEASDVHFSYFENVVGSDEEGATYLGHFSWIYAFNDEVELDQDTADVLANGASAVVAPSTEPVMIESNEVNLWQWLAAQVLPDVE